MVSVTSLLLSVTTSFAVFSCLVLLYFWLSSIKQNYFVYYPARIIKGLGIPETKRFYTMLWEAWIAKEEDLWRAGVDSAVYVLFLKAGGGGVNEPVPLAESAWRIQITAEDAVSGFGMFAIHVQLTKALIIEARHNCSATCGTMSGGHYQ